MKDISSSVTETKGEAFLFCLEVNSATVYPELQQPIKSREKHYPPPRYMLIGDNL